VAEQAIAGGELEAANVAALAREELERCGAEPEYVEVVSAHDLSRLERLEGQQALIAIAARVGATRLIDNTVVGVPAGAAEGRNATDVSNS
jgi:pantoate--beta-alanine ligase